MILVVMSDGSIREIDPSDGSTREITPEVTTLGGPGSGNFGHAGRPGQIGGSSSEGGEGKKDSKASQHAHFMPTWKSEGGWEHTGIEWKQETDPETGRPIPVQVDTVEEGVDLVLSGVVVEVKDVATAHTLINKLAEVSIQASKDLKAGEEPQNFDLCNVTVAGTSLFCAESLRTPEYPEGIPRLEMPQLGGEPVPGSEADKLPRTPWDPKNVDGADKFISHLQGIGIKTAREVVPAASLIASQRELKGVTVAGMMNDKSFDPAKNPVFVSSDDYVVDGHHRWAAVVGRDAEDGVLGDAPMNIIRVNAPISEVLHLANAWAAKFGIKQTAGVKKQAIKTGLLKLASASYEALGGEGSGNFGHAGRPGQKGGSSSSGGTIKDASPQIQNAVLDIASDVRAKGTWKYAYNSATFRTIDKIAASIVHDSFKRSNLLTSPLTTSSLGGWEITGTVRTRRS